MTQHPVRYASVADQEYTDLMKRVARKWGIQAARKLNKQIKAKEQYIARYPEASPISDYNPRLRKCVVTPQTILFYTIKPTEVVITTVFDARQDPETPSQRD